MPMKKMKRFVVFAMLILAMALPVFGAVSIDLTRDCSLHIQYQYQGNAIAEAEFHVYRAADVAPDGTFTLCGVFCAYPVVVNGLNQVQMAMAAQTLYGLAQLDTVAPDYTVVTDEHGEGELQNLKPGLYLVAGQRLSNSDSVFTAAPQLVVLPGQEQSQKEWIYQAVLRVKPSYDPLDPPDDPEKTVTRKVLKIWEDQGCTEHRPAQIEVVLLRNGEIYDSVLLSDENNWRYSWDGLDDEAVWSIQERVPEGYTVMVEKEGITTVITNTCTEEPPPPEEPDDPKPDKPEDSNPEEPRLPQTGMLWWPVPVLIALGLSLILAGLFCRRRERR